MCLWFLFVFFFKRTWNDSVFADKASGLLNSRTDCLLLYLHDFFLMSLVCLTVLTFQSPVENSWLLACNGKP